MFEIKQGDVTYAVEFKHSSRKRKPKNRVTECVLTVRDMFGPVVFSAKAHPCGSDQFCYEDGRRVALAKVLDKSFPSSGGKDTERDSVHKVIRRDIWAAYWRAKADARRVAEAKLKAERDAAQVQNIFVNVDVDNARAIEEGGSGETGKVWF